MEVAVSIISVGMAACGPGVIRSSPGTYAAGTRERVSRKLGGWIGLVMGIAPKYAPLDKSRLFIAIRVGGLASDGSWDGSTRCLPL